MKTINLIKSQKRRLTAPNCGLREQAEHDFALYVELSARAGAKASSPLSSAGAVRKHFLTALVCAAFIASPLFAADISLASAPPVVVKTVPPAGATDVDPGLAEIKVTYSKAMQDRSWSWCWWENKDAYPETTGDPKYLQDGRTCVLPVKLQPNKFYALWLNTEKFKNFKDTSGRSAVPYLLTFFTGDSAIPKQPPTEVIAEAVGTVSQCTEGDPRVGQALSRLRSLPEREVVSGLVSYLESSKNTVRRSAVYLLQNGGFADITPAAAELQKLLAHQEDLTRGMAALALGQNHVNESFEALAQMTKEDSSGYARRCAAYALGLLGDPRAEPVLKTALNDPEALVRSNAKAALAMIKNGRGLQRPVQEKPDRGNGFIQLLNDDQRAVLEWTDRQFRSYFDERTFDGWSEQERATLERKLIDSLKGPHSREYYQAINTLAALRSPAALAALREIAYDRREKDNRDRWMAIRALGMLGEQSDVPELIPLVYHGNSNTRWWAQISLVRLTGQNFAKDWNGWGKWWNDQNGQPPFKPEIIRWWSGQAEPDKLAESLAASDRSFIAGLKPRAAATASVSESSVSASADPVQERMVNKLVSDFPEARDLSSPESACAAWQRANARKDAQAISQMSLVPIPPKETEEWLRREEVRDAEGLAIYLKALADSKVVSVQTWRGELASVITFLPFPEGKGRHPYSARTFGRAKGEWKNLGEDRLPTADAARQNFERKKEYLWKEYNGYR